MKMRGSIFILLCLLAQTPSIAQVQYIPSTAHRFTVSAGGGITYMFGDLGNPIMEYAGKASIDYNITPFFSAGIEGQAGMLSSKGIYLDPNRKVGNIKQLGNYYAADANARLELGQFLQHSIQTGFIRVLDGIYVGTGFGVISTNNKATIIKNPEPNNAPLQGFHDNNTACFIPVNVGINVGLPKNFAAFLNIEENFGLSDYIDGYHSAYSSSNDIYAFISAGFRFSFGPVHIHTHK